ncbi:MAG TPA: enoyl-CoA hydratase-related protein [Ilumatobacter sp.]|nr:enoyl-CoA hydratase-related protein [Ilumatobacter sp.]
MEESVHTYLQVDRDGDVITITLDHPEKRNALALHVMTELTDALRTAGGSDALGVIIAANGPVFSAGHNFGDMLGASLDDVQHLFAVCAELMQTIQDIPQVVIAKVHALASAAGCQLVASCDLAIAAESAGFALPGGKGGLFCHTPLVAVARQIGRKRALEMALTGDPIAADVAADWGLINSVVHDQALDAAVDDLMRRATRGSAPSKAEGKRTFYAQVDMTQPDAYTFTTAIMSAGAVAPDGQEGIASFLEKRHPEFTQQANAQPSPTF